MNLGALRSQLFQTGSDLLNVAYDAVTGVMTAQLGDSVNQVPQSNNAEIWGTPGIASRPSPAVPGSSGSQCVVLKCGDRDVIIAQRDLRAANAFGNLEDGETVIYALGSDGKSSAKIALKDDGSVTIGTTDSGKAGGNAVLLQIAADGLNFVAPWGKMTFDSTGFHVSTNGGPALDMGVCGGLSGPFAALSSYFTVNSCGMAQLNAAHVMLGPAALTYNPATLVLAENPLTTPPIPILTTFPGAPSGVQGSSSVSIAL